MTRGVPFSLMMLLLLGISATAYAQATRTWVSGVGDDANPCSRTAPCKTFAGAISKTAAGGEIDVLDPGGFGAVTITKAITIDGSGGSIAGVLVAGTNGITVNAGATDTVILRHLDFEGLGTGLSGILFEGGGTLIVDNSTITAFTDSGIKLTNTAQCLLEVHNVQITGAGTGTNIVGGNATVFLRKVSISNATTGILSTTSKVSLAQSDLINNTVATSGSYFNSFNDNYFVGNGSDGVISQ
jgi:hypothetical protein